MKGSVMDYKSYEKRLDYILELIQKNRFLSLESASRKFEVSTRTLKRMLNHLREQGHDIRYDRQQKKYFIKKDEWHFLSLSGPHLWFTMERLKNFFYPAIEFLLILLWVYAALSKLFSFDEFRGQMYNQTFPHWMASSLIYLLPPVELATALLLVPKITRMIGLISSLVLLASFTAHKPGTFKFLGTGPLLLWRNITTHGLENSLGL